MISKPRLDEILSRFGGLNMALLGDLFLDRYLELSPQSETSIETGLEAYQVERIRNAAGALGTVMNNLASLGVGRLTPITFTGEDGHGFDLREVMRELPLDDTHLLSFPDRMTPTYMKPLRPTSCESWEELNRLDVRTREPMSHGQTDAIVEHLSQAFNECDGLIVLDQVDQTDRGVVNSDIREALHLLIESTPDKLVVIDSRSHLHEFRHGMLKGNRSEFLAAAAEEQDVEKAVAALSRRNKQPAFCTMGETGVLIATPDGTIEHAEGVSVEGPIDIVGAGDSFTAATFASLLSDATPREAAEIGNLAASVTIRQIGTTGVATQEQIFEARAKIEA
jgi:rfaE bifunctional protein kinase chain/domain